MQLLGLIRCMLMLVLMQLVSGCYRSDRDNDILWDGFKIAMEYGPKNNMTQQKKDAFLSNIRWLDVCTQKHGALYYGIFWFFIVPLEKPENPHLRHNMEHFDNFTNCIPIRHMNDY